ncbi:MAG: aldo/keto reductase [Planctomycetota bacterium]|nr:aldo/keto reductase [Planctomycetota bacterium]
MNEIKKRPLGKTKLQITEVAFGGLFLAETLGTARDEAMRVVERALELGINYIDTAPMYGNSQEIIGEVLEGRKEDCLLATKCGRWDWQTGPFRQLDAFKTQFEQSLKFLRRDSVDILYIHEADWAVYWQDMDQPRSRCEVDPDASYDYASAPVVRFLQWAKEQKLASHLGISGNNAHLLKKVLPEIDLEIDAVLVAFQYSLIWRNAKQYLLPAAGELGAGVVLGAPLQQGRLAVPHEQWLEQPPDWMDDDLRERFRKLYDIQKEAGLTLPEMAIRFLLAEPDFTTVIPGAANIEQLEENVNCSKAGPLDPDLHAKLDSLGKVFPGLWGKDY